MSGLGCPTILQLLLHPTALSLPPPLPLPSCPAALPAAAVGSTAHVDAKHARMLRTRRRVCNQIHPRCPTQHCRRCYGRRCTRTTTPCLGTIVRPGVSASGTWGGGAGSVGRGGGQVLWASACRRVWGGGRGKGRRAGAAGGTGRAGGQVGGIRAAGRQEGQGHLGGKGSAAGAVALPCPALPHCTWPGASSNE